MSANLVKAYKKVIKADGGITESTRHRMDVQFAMGKITEEEYAELEEYAEQFESAEQN